MPESCQHIFRILKYTSLHRTERKREKEGGNGIGEHRISNAYLRKCTGYESWARAQWQPPPSGSYTLMSTEHLTRGEDSFTQWYQQVSLKSSVRKCHWSPQGLLLLLWVEDRAGTCHGESWGTECFPGPNHTGWGGYRDEDSLAAASTVHKWRQNTARTLEEIRVERSQESNEQFCVAKGVA